MASVSDFLKEKRTESTRIAYFSGLCSFVECIYGLPEKTGLRRTKEHRQTCAEKIDQYVTEDRSYGDDLTSLIKYLEKRKASPQQINIAITAVKEFLFFNRKKLDEFDLRRVTKNKPAVSVDNSRDYDLDHEVLRKLFIHCNLTIKTIILMLISSGARINEILSLKVSDIEFKEGYGILYLERENTKSKKARFTFISKECVEVLKEYLQKEKPETLLFDFTYENALYMLNLAVKNAGFDNDKKKIHFHLFRKFFMSQLKLAIPSEIVEMLAGHKGYLSDSYRRYTEKQLAEEYLKGEYLVTIQNPKGIKEFENEFQVKMQGHTEILESLVKKNIKLEETLTRVETENKMTNEIFQTVMSDPTMLSTLKEMLDIVKQVKENPKIIQRIAKIIKS